MLKKEYLGMFGIEPIEGAAVETLAKPPPDERKVEPYVEPKMDVTVMVRPKTNVDIAKAKQIAGQIYSDYGRKLLITVADITRDEMDIRHDIKTFLYNGVRQMMIVPDFSPVDGRLHYHGVVNITSLRDFNRSLIQLRKYVGNTWVKMGEKKNMDYLFKIYEKNSKTPPGTVIETITLKQLIVKL